MSVLSWAIASAVGLRGVLDLPGSGLLQRLVNGLDGGLLPVLLLNLSGRSDGFGLVDMDALEDGLCKPIQPSHEFQADLMDGYDDWDFAFESFLNTTLPRGLVIQGESKFAVS